MKRPLVFLALLLPLAAAAESGIPAEELARAPSPARIAALVDRAAAGPSVA